MSTLINVALFFVGAVLTIGATELLVGGLVGIGAALSVSAFAVGAVLSGFEAENIAVGLAAGETGSSPLALGTVFGGAIFLICVALGLGALLFPLEVRLPRGFLFIFAASPLLVGLSFITPIPMRWVGLVLLVAFGACMTYIIVVSYDKEFLASKEVEKAKKKQRPLWFALGATLVGIVIITIGGAMVALGAEGIVASLNIPALLMGMVVTPAVISSEEVVRQVIPSKRGRHDVSAGNLIGTSLYFLLCNLGLILFVTPVHVDPQVRQLDWPFLIGVTWLATAFLWRGRVGRLAGVLFLVAYACYIALHLVLH